MAAAKIKLDGEQLLDRKSEGGKLTNMKHPHKLPLISLSLLPCLWLLSFSPWSLTPWLRKATDEREYLWRRDTIQLKEGETNVYTTLEFWEASPHFLDHLIWNGNCRSTLSFRPPPFSLLPIFFLPKHARPPNHPSVAASRRRSRAKATRLGRPPTLAVVRPHRWLGLNTILRLSGRRRRPMPSPPGQPPPSSG